MVVGFFPSVVIGSEWACDTFAASETGGKVCCQATGLGFHLPRKESTPSSPGRCPVRWWHLEFYANLNLQREWARGLRPMMRTSIWRGGTWSPGNIFYPVTVSSSGPWISSRSLGCGRCGFSYWLSQCDLGFPAKRVLTSTTWLP